MQYRTPLSIAIRSSHLDCIKLLLKYGANPNSSAVGSLHVFSECLVFLSRSNVNAKQLILKTFQILWK